MGHADISTTMRYAHLSPGTKRRALEFLCGETTGRSIADGRKAPDGSTAQVVEKHGAPETTRTSDKRFRKAKEDEEPTD
jgi:hypothetical protein